MLPLLDALRAVVNLDNDDRDHVEYIDPGRAEALLMAPLGGLDATDARRLGRQLRTGRRQLTPRVRHPRRARPASCSARPWCRTASSTGSPVRRADRARTLHALLAGARAELAEGATAEEVLWTLWSGTALAAPAAQRGRRPAEAPRRLANRDLDAARARCSRPPPAPRSSAATPASATS